MCEQEREGARGSLKPSRSGGTWTPFSYLSALRLAGCRSRGRPPVHTRSLCSNSFSSPKFLSLTIPIDSKAAPMSSPMQNRVVIRAL